MPKPRALQSADTSSRQPAAACWTGGRPPSERPANASTGSFNATRKEGDDMCSTREHRAHRRGHRRFGNRDQWLATPEEHQRDLQQELADVADITRRPKADAPPQTASD